MTNKQRTAAQDALNRDKPKHKKYLASKSLRGVRPLKRGDLVIQVNDLVQNTLEDNHFVLSVLTDEEYELWQGFLQELRVENHVFGLGALLRDHQRIIDELWDEKLSRPSSVLDALAEQVQADADAGLTLDLTPDMLNDEVKTHPAFWKQYNELPKEVQQAARNAYRWFRENPSHPGLQFKALKGKKALYSARIGRHYRAIGRMTADDEITWFWIGSHDEYDTLLG